MSEINVTPLVDVMLVLLIIFIITIPVITQSVKVELPKAANQATQTKPENINIAVDKDGNVYWNTALVPTQEALLDRLKCVAVHGPAAGSPRARRPGDQVRARRPGHGAGAAQPASRRSGSSPSPTAGMR